jgi:hypothetical protein
MLWRDQVIDWGNLKVQDGTLQLEIGYVSGQAPREKAFRIALNEELLLMETFCT